MKNHLTFIVFAFLFTACSKKQGPSYYYLSSDAKKHFYFKPGSYWIYCDSISGRTDSFYLRNSSLFMLSGGGGSENNIVEMLTLEIIQHSRDATIKDSILWQYTFRYSTVTFTYYNISKDFRYSSFLNYPFKLSNGKAIGTLPLGTNTFSDTWEFDGKGSNASGFYAVNYFLNDSMLLLKMRENYSITYAPTINEVWELQRWHVVK